MVEEWRSFEGIPWRIAARGRVFTVAAGVTSSCNSAVGSARSIAEQSSRRKGAENSGSREDHLE